ALRLPQRDERPRRPYLLVRRLALHAGRGVSRQGPRVLVRTERGVRDPGGIGSEEKTPRTIRPRKVSGQFLLPCSPGAEKCASGSIRSRLILPGQDPALGELNGT